MWCIWRARVPFVVECGAGHFGHLFGEGVGGDGDDSLAADGDDGRVSASSPLKTMKRPGSVADFADLSDVSAGFFDGGDVGDFGQADQGCGLQVDAGAAGNIVKNDGISGGFGDGAEVLELALLGGLVVVGRGGEDGVHTLEATSEALATASAVQ